ncbi:hypothetical protein BBB50_15495 [Vibrio cholerae 2740-80]|nr:hypothetical protein BBB50_15495 [Vibrio cholerae 2740-80]EGR0659895.1 hypothetical protein [Vibrio cholerae]MCO4752686.1 hypothetical protein [Vibrio cholerae O1 biovar El Tor]HAS6017197.1 hypothetical protein [Vibrio cholerae O1]EGR1083734.1 hypothetical protein [Vibrio cholerae]
MYFNKINEKYARIGITTKVRQYNIEITQKTHSLNRSSGQMPFHNFFIEFINALSLAILSRVELVT